MTLNSSARIHSNTVRATQLTFFKHICDDDEIVPNHDQDELENSSRDDSWTETEDIGVDKDL